MADKISTIILKVDLDCRRCYKKISKTICKLQERENIQTIIFDEKTNTVTISGPFDPKKMCKKLCSKACNVIKDIQIKENKEKPKETKPAEKDKPKDTKPAKDKAEDAKPAAAAEPKEDKPKAAPEKTKEKHMEKPQETKVGHLTEAKKDRVDPPASITGTEPVWQPAWAGPGSACGCRPLYGGYYGDNRGCWCGGGGGYGGSWVPEGPPPPAVYGVPVYGGGYNKPGTFFCEEDPQASCSVM